MKTDRFGGRRPNPIGQRMAQSYSITLPREYVSAISMEAKKSDVSDSSILNEVLTRFINKYFMRKDLLKAKIYGQPRQPTGRIYKGYYLNLDAVNKIDSIAIDLMQKMKMYIDRARLIRLAIELYLFEEGNP